MMKNNPLHLLIILLTGFISTAQNNEPGGKQINPYNLTIQGLDQFMAEKPKGSPYLQAKFAQAKINNLENKFNVRYNAYSDEFEFLNSKNDTLLLDKVDDFSTITFMGSNKKYHLVTYSNNIQKPHKGYLIELYQKNNLTLYKREWISFYAAKKAKTSLEKDMPARFNKEKDSYYLKDTNGNITDFPESKKQLTRLFPDKKEAIETFVKDNKIDFDADPDKVKIINFLAQ